MIFLPFGGVVIEHWGKLQRLLMSSMNGAFKIFKKISKLRNLRLKSTFADLKFFLLILEKNFGFKKNSESSKILANLKSQQKLHNIPPFRSCHSGQHLL